MQVKWLRREETSPLQAWNGGEATAACPPTPHASMLGLVRTSGDLRNFRWPGTPPFSNCRPLARNNIEAGGQRGCEDGRRECPGHLALGTCEISSVNSSCTAAAMVYVLSMHARVVRQVYRATHLSVSSLSSPSPVLANLPQ